MLHLFKETDRNCIHFLISPFSEFQQNLFKEAAENSAEATSRSAGEDSSSEAVVAAAAGVGGRKKGGSTRRVLPLCA